MGMALPPRPHRLGVDDAPFEKRQSAPVPIIGVVMEGPDRIESVALGQFPVDGEDATDYMAGWIGGLRARPTLQGAILGGITIAGLALVDVTTLAERLGLPVLVVTRRNPSDRSGARPGRVARAGLEARRSIPSTCVNAVMPEWWEIDRISADPNSGAGHMSSDDTEEPPEPPIPEVDWDIRREGRAWTGDEAMAR
jgi:hypothetical protein